MKCWYHTSYETPVSTGRWCTKFGVLCDSPFEDSDVDECGQIMKEEAEC